MSLFSWFLPKKAPAKAKPMEPTGLLNADATVPLVPGRDGRSTLEAPPPDHAANRKNERMERRELLYSVVRDAMVKAAVLSASYKFKVLSLDQRGSQFLVMMDLAPEYGGDMDRLGEIETLIAQSAKTRFGIGVPAVYWRTNAQIVVGAALRQAVAGAPAQSRVPEFTAGAVAASPVVVAPRPAAARQAAPRPTALVPPTVPEVAPGSTRFDPIEADEVAAFKQALVNAAGRAPQAPVEPGVATRSGPLLPPSPALTGFEDTVMPSQEGRSPDLSSTQYGDLR